ncbi:MAG: type II toxin-antitoxin system VapC family toxin, partial [Nitrospinota bacterium]
MKLPWAYFDTSVYLKLYVREKGSEETRKLAKKKRILSSAILLTECFSALSRKKDEGYLTDEDFGKLANHIKEDLSYIEIVRLTDDALEKAEDVALISTA